jgi:hypothetical protein
MCSSGSWMRSAPRTPRSSIAVGRRSPTTPRSTSGTRV